MRVVTFTSDFGPFDEFVGICHAVIARIAPGVRVIDLTHGILPGPDSVRAGAAALAQSVPYSPPDAVHLAVVDPGVGTERRGVVLTTGVGALLVGPDNGLLLWAADALGGVIEAFELAEGRYRLEPVSSTFHGRDVFAPAAGHLAMGIDPSRFGRPVGDLVRLPAPRVSVSEGLLECDVLRRDWFGNLQLAARGIDLEAAGIRGRVRVEAGDRHIDARVVRTFGDLEQGELGVLVDSAGHVALSVNGGNASDRLAAPGTLRILGGD